MAKPFSDAASTTEVTTSEVPPISKKSSVAPTRSSLSAFLKASQKNVSVALAGATYSPRLTGTGSGSSLVSVLPLAVMGISLSWRYAVGTI